MSTKTYSEDWHFRIGEAFLGKKHYINPLYVEYKENSEMIHFQNHQQQQFLAIYHKKLLQFTQLITRLYMDEDVDLHQINTIINEYNLQKMFPYYCEMKKADEKVVRLNKQIRLLKLYYDEIEEEDTKKKVEQMITEKTNLQQKLSQQIIENEEIEKHIAMLKQYELFIKWTEKSKTFDQTPI